MTANEQGAIIRGHGRLPYALVSDENFRRMVDKSTPHYLAPSAQKSNGQAHVRFQSKFAVL